jgi:hypothetical protein
MAPDCRLPPERVRRNGRGGNVRSGQEASAGEAAKVSLGLLFDKSSQTTVETWKRERQAQAELDGRVEGRLSGTRRRQGFVGLFDFGGGLALNGETISAGEKCL